MAVPAERLRVDVVIVTYESRDLTVATIGRLLAAEPDLDLRVLVHDNASTDGTADAVAAAHPSALVERSDRNLGFAAGANRAAARGDAPWLLLLNSDAWPEPGALARLLAEAVARPGAALVTPRLERPDGGWEPSAHPFPSLRVAATCVLPGGARRFEVGGGAGGPVAIDWAVGAAWLVRRAAWEELGGLDERFFFYVEDVDWCRRAQRHGWTAWLVPGAVFRHVGGASSPERSAPDKARRYLANTAWWYRREHGLAAALAYRALNVLGAARLWVVAVVRRDAATRRLCATHVRANLGHWHHDPSAAPGG